ncbi:hypothetical protein E4U61_006017 [Claviceps capensis]|nr:hypothetical protein E4U61_006017 [Claviceps capensis]
MASSRFMEEYLNRPGRMQPEASSSQDTSSGLSSCLQLSSTPPPTASEGKGKAKLTDLAPPSINSCVRKPRLSNQERSFRYQDDMFVRDKVDVADKYAARIAREDAYNITWFRGSGQRKQQFGETKVADDSDHLQFNCPNTTRWNSIFLAANRFLVVKDRLLKFWQEWYPVGADTGLHPADMLTTDDWLELELIDDALETFHAATMHVEGHGSFLSNWTNAIDMLMDMIGEARDNFKKLAKLHASYSKNKDDGAKAQDALVKCKRYEFLFKCSSEVFEKAEKYYNHCDKAAAYYLAIVLDPRDKMNWFHQQWVKYPTTKATWIPGVRRQVLEVWDDEYYQSPFAALPTRSGDADEPSPCRSSSSKYARFFTNRHVVGGQAPQAIDHFRQYLDEDPIAAEQDFDVIDY